VGDVAAQQQAGGAGRRAVGQVDEPGPGGRAPVGGGEVAAGGRDGERPGQGLRVLDEADHGEVDLGGPADLEAVAHAEVELGGQGRGHGDLVGGGGEPAGHEVDHPVGQRVGRVELPHNEVHRLTAGRAQVGPAPPVEDDPRAVRQ